MSTHNRLRNSFSRSYDAEIRVYAAAGNVIEAHEHTGDFKEWSALFASGQHSRSSSFSALLSPEVNAKNARR
jgi:hypothetical protein